MANTLEECNKFFKVFLPSFSSLQLDIPPAFVTHFRGIIPNKAVLKDQTGKLWLVELEEAESGLTIKNGWQCFATENSLEYGDFLVFEYDGKYLFDVEIFGRNGCKKEVSSSKIAASDAKDEKEKELLQTCSSPSKQKCSIANLYKLRRNRARMHVDGKALKEATYVKPKGPHFVRIVRKWTHNVLFFRKSLLDSNGIKIKPPAMVLLDENEKEWPVTIRFRNNYQVVINHGWHHFFKEYNLQLGDKCVFEFVLGRDKSCQKMLVKVVRKQSKDLKF